MSENWVSKMWFGVADIGSVAGSTTSAPEISTGSGSLPVIQIAADYWLRDEYGEVLTDETGEGLSLEGLNA